MERLASALGLVLLLGLTFALSERRKAIDKRVVFWGIGLQLLFALLVLGVPALGFTGPFRFLFSYFNDVTMQILAFSDEGARFIFGPLMDPEKSGGFIFAVRVLPTIVFFSALIAVFYYLGILQRVVAGIAYVIRKCMRVGGAESLSTAANIFLGQTEAPLLVRPYLPKMTRSELLCIMIGGMANTAGGVLAAYVALLHSRFPDIAGHLLTVSIMSAPASILVSKILLPETEKLQDETDAHVMKVEDANIIEAATRGAGEGLSLALNVGAMLVAFIALVALTNAVVQTGTFWLSEPLTLQKLFGWTFAPLAFLLGVPWADAMTVGTLLAEKIVLNEFVAYAHLSELAPNISDRAMLLTSYALCGFANFSSIGIQVGGIGAMAPGRRSDLARLGLKALIGGNIATFISTCIVGILM